MTLPKGLKLANSNRTLRSEMMNVITFGNATLKLVCFPSSIKKIRKTRVGRLIYKSLFVIYRYFSFVFAKAQSKYLFFEYSLNDDGFLILKKDSYNIFLSYQNFVSQDNNIRRIKKYRSNISMIIY